MRRLKSTFLYTYILKSSPFPQSVSKVAASWWCGHGEALAVWKESNQARKVVATLENFQTFALLPISIIPEPWSFTKKKILISTRPFLKTDLGEIFSSISCPIAPKNHCSRTNFGPLSWGFEFSQLLWQSCQARHLLTLTQGIPDLKLPPLRRPPSVSLKRDFYLRRGWASCRSFRMYKKPICLYIFHFFFLSSF